MVTSQNMIESEMGNRGSKSEFVFDLSNTKINSVKEQRVDGS